jgi:hypothetical protein
MYAQSGAGKTSLLNAGLIPRIEKDEFEVFPPARISGLLPKKIDPNQIENRFSLNVLSKWSGDQVNPEELLKTRLTGSRWLLSEM